MISTVGLKKLCLALAAVALLGLSGQPAKAQESAMHVAFGDVPEADLLNFLAAVSRAEKRGVKVKITYLTSEDIAAQAVVSGQADIGVGTPYALIQKVKAPIRMFFQLSALRFFPIVNTEFYKTWKDLDGADIYVHARGSGTEAIMNLMAKKNGIKYKTVSYIPGSSVRAGAMLQGRIKVTIVDSERRRLLLRKGKGKFALLPLPEINASDEALYANIDFLKSQSGAIDILIEELLNVWREINKNPEAILGMRKQYNLLPDMPKKDVADILSYYKETVDTGAFSNNGGGVKAVKGDFEFYGFAGTIKGDLSKLKVEDFWYLDPLNKALDKLGRM
ncbi:MAG: ABC transporter substrate-binding protein [Proteobacteria bacterium]|nr:ABC transporter substrate-binding protein [Pseudomonadota bacterium]